MEVFKMGYEYQENGMMAMTIELTPMEVTNAIAQEAAGSRYLHCRRRRRGWL